MSLGSHVNHNMNSGTLETKCIALGCTSPDWSCHSNFPALLLLSLQHKPDKQPDTAFENTNRPYFLLLSKVLPWLCISLKKESKILRVAHKSCHLSDLAGLVPSYFSASLQTAFTSGTPLLLCTCCCALNSYSNSPVD